ncbi:hypothetical protein [Anatilimnocola floriformis]|uniref:hypothetical protein n=1 Tax=Anatilimnocola floriformis TaxID=2948575 RepID=UPI0020C23B4A|nr:hypothetical protein [Anatilimnocola floriformis]
MDRTRKATREGNEITLQYQTAADSQLIEELVEEQLRSLQSALAALQLTPEGQALLQRRTKAFGDCERAAEESSRSYYQKLSRWLFQELPISKAPLHPPRQVT